MKREAATLDEITREDFEAYEQVRESGVCNMWSSEVEDLAGITPEVKIGIIKHYSALLDKYPDVREPLDI